MLGTIVLFVVVILVLVVAHELGHFFAARVCKVRVEEFGVGYPPRAKKLFTWKETLFTLNWLPFGGFVKIAGEQSITHDVRSFAYQKLWKRLFIVSAGVIANLLLAVLLYATSYMIGFLASPQDFPNAHMTSAPRAVVADVSLRSPAEKAGFKTGDTIETMSVGTDTLAKPSSDAVRDFTSRHEGARVNVLLVRASGTQETVQVVPVRRPAGASHATIGVSVVDVAMVRLSFGSALRQGVVQTVHDTGSIVRSLGMLVAGVFKGSTNLLAQVAGPLGIAQIAGDAYAFGIGALLSFMAIISINLAVINLLPFPALDGGRFILELFARKGTSKIPLRIVGLINQIGFALLIVFAVMVTYHDILRLLA